MLEFHYWSLIDCFSIYVVFTDVILPLANKMYWIVRVCACVVAVEKEGRTLPRKWIVACCRVFK